MLIDAAIVVLAIVCAPAMVYGIWAGYQRDRGRDVPTAGELLASAFAALAPLLSVLAVVWYAARRVVCYAWVPGEDERPALINRYVKSRGSADARDGSFAPNEPPNEPPNDRFAPVQMPNGDGSSFGGYPDVFAVLGALVEAGTITASRAYDLLGVTRGSSAAYKDARERLTAARLRASGQVRYQELDSESRPTGRYVSRTRRGT